MAVRRDVKPADSNAPEADIYRPPASGQCSCGFVSLGLARIVAPAGLASSKFARQMPSALRAISALGDWPNRRLNAVLRAPSDP